MGNHDMSVRAAFGDSNRADSVPDCLAPSDGPVYLEGRLVLSLSFRGGFVDGASFEDAGDPLERYRLWDDFSETWLDDGWEVLRYEQGDIVVCNGPKPAVLWKGAIDTRARVVPVPDLDDVGMEANEACDLRWRRV